VQERQARRPGQEASGRSGDASHEAVLAAFAGGRQGCRCIGTSVTSCSFVVEAPSPHDFDGGRRGLRLSTERACTITVIDGERADGCWRSSAGRRRDCPAPRGAGVADLHAGAICPDRRAPGAQSASGDRAASRRAILTRFEPGATLPAPPSRRRRADLRHRGRQRGRNPVR